MDKTFDEDDFLEGRNLHARENSQSSGNTSQDMASGTHMDEALIKKTRSVWEPLYGREITDAEAMGIIEKFSDVLEVLAEFTGGDDTGIPESEGGIGHG